MPAKLFRIRKFRALRTAWGLGLSDHSRVMERSGLTNPKLTFRLDGLPKRITHLLVATMPTGDSEKLIELLDSVEKQHSVAVIYRPAVHGPHVASHEDWLNDLGPRFVKLEVHTLANLRVAIQQQTQILGLALAPQSALPASSQNYMALGEGDSFRNRGPQNEIRPSVLAKVLKTATSSGPGPDGYKRGGLSQ